MSFPCFLLAAGAMLLASCSLGGSRVRTTSASEVPEVSLRILYEAGIRGTAVGLVKNPVTTVRKGVHVAHRRSEEILHPPLVMSLVDSSQGAPGTDGFENYLDQWAVGVSSRGNIDVLVDGDEFFPRLEQSIAQARSEIDWRVYIFDNDDYACAVADQLKARSDSVEVRVLFDRLGTYLASKVNPATPFPRGFDQPRSIKWYLRRRSEVAVRPVGNPWLMTDHCKVLIFDREVAYLGGMNIGREYRSEWHDLMVELRGDVVNVLADEFDRQWSLAGYWGDLGAAVATKRPPVPSTGTGFPIRVLRTGPQVYEVERAHLAAVRAARDSIVVVTPYFSSDRLIGALAAAARRGVEVDVILPGQNNSAIMGVSNWDTARALMRGGVRVHHYPGKSHLKASRVDGWVCLGSANLDTLSFRINHECNIAFSDPAVVAEVDRRVFRRDLRKARRLETSDLEGKGSPLMEILADQL